MAENIVELSDSSFNRQVMESETPVVVDFWAPWCGPCKMIGPIMSEIAGEYQGRLTVAKMDIATHPVTAANFGIRSIPALLFVKEGKVASTMVGLQSKDKIVKQIEELINS